MKSLLTQLVSRFGNLSKLPVDLLDNYFIPPYVRLWVNAQNQYRISVLVPSPNFRSILLAYGVYPGSTTYSYPTCVDAIKEIAPHIEVELDSISEGVLVVYTRDRDWALEAEYPFDYTQFPDFSTTTHQWRRIRFRIDMRTNRVIDYTYYFHNVNDDYSVQEVVEFGADDHKLKSFTLEQYQPNSAVNYHFFPLRGIDMADMTMHSEYSVDYAYRWLTLQPPQET